MLLLCSCRTSSASGLRGQDGGRTDLLQRDSIANVAQAALERFCPHLHFHPAMVDVLFETPTESVHTTPRNQLQKHAIEDGRKAIP